MLSVRQFAFASLLVGLGSFSLLAGEGEKFEYKAVNLGKDEKSATSKLNDLLQDGWEIHGVVGNNLTAFRRKVEPKAEVSKPKKEEPKKEEPRKEEPKKSEPKKEEPKKEVSPKPEEKKPEKPAKETPKPNTVAAPMDEAPEVPKATPIIDKIAADVNPNPKDAPAPPAMMPEEKPAERTATKPQDQIASATPTPEKSVLKTNKPEILPDTIISKPAAAEINALQGTWGLMVYVLNGRQIRSEDPRSTWTVEGDRWTSRWVGENGSVQVASGTMRFVENKNGVRSVDLIHTEGLYKGRTTFSIVQQEGDSIKYCYSGSAESRPQTFSSSEGDGTGLVLWRKQK